ncbi:2-amino-4-hydroxy-6-hydroxymethyldihydropteridine diphosphokinase [Parapedobacter pyrenivorans]|nr:2-amino-4-hydroxy-6-hydroxymethyldihydropteridine diphosphokinase [Parapedobacter pyrenivorans]
MSKSMSVTVDVYLLLGTNMGNRIALLEQARNEITREIGITRKISSVYETRAWGDESQPNYLNQVVLSTTLLHPLQLLKKINTIEKKMGRTRVNKWESRPIDIDILYYADRIIDEPTLQVPHPHLPNRRFALIPLQEIAPQLIHPTSKKTTVELLSETADQLSVQLYKPHTYEQHQL